MALPEDQVLPRQDAGLRYSRALPYVLHAHARSSHGDELSVDFDNQGRAGAVLHVYDRLHLERLPRRYTIEAGKSLSDAGDTADDEWRRDLWILGPNGFPRQRA